MRRLVAFLVLSGLLVLPAAAQASTAEAGRVQAADVLEFERASNPQISPDGRHIVYTRSHVNQLEDRWESELWIMRADGSKHRYLTDGASPQWSPDGTRLAYLAPGDPAGTQLFVRWMDDGATSQITRVAETPTSVRWAPDGRSLAFVMRVPDEESWSIPMPSPPEGATWTKPPRIIRELHYRRDRQGFTELGHTHLFVVPADGGTPRPLTHGDWSVGIDFSGLRLPASLAWTPDGREIVFDGLVHDDHGGDGYRQSYLYAVDVETGARRRLTTQKGAWANPVVAPDGRHVAFTGYPYTLQTYKTSELYVIGIDGAGMRLLSGDLDRDAGQLHWSRDGRGVYFTAQDRGARNIHFAPLDGPVRAVTEGTHMLSLSSLAPSGLAAATRTAPHDPNDVVAVDLASGAITRLTRLNDDLLAGKTLGEVEELWYDSTDDTRVQGWIVKPPGFDPAEAYPLILHIHGGPHAMYNVGYSHTYQTYAANGFVVLYTNPRGSTGYGTAFGNAIDDGYPSVDHDDLMAGVDAVLDRGYIDPDRLYVTGCSGGGVLSSWAIGQTDRFAAAAVRCPVTNWISFAGTADIVRWSYERFDGYFWDNPEKWLAHSPLMHVGNVKTPVLLMTGELDLRTPMSQTEEYYAALKMLGVPAVLLRFHGEYHGTGSKPSNNIRTMLYIMDWFNQHPEAPDVTMRE
ncbi:MAG: S9 family peptidase [Rhodothermales bacterium]|nr:S9 family peptidase [Rhodothermales bacterium]